MSAIDPKALAAELAGAYANRRRVDVLPSARDAGFDLPVAYAVEAELVRLRRLGGHAPVGRKVGFANKAMWRALKLDTLVWAHIYDDTVHYAHQDTQTLSLGRMYSPKIEPEIVFKLKQPPSPDKLNPATILESVEWLAIGFEIIDCVFADWKFQPADLVASYGLHAALVVGPLRVVKPTDIPALVEALSRFTVKLLKDGHLIEEGSGKNALRSPALCLGELAAAIARQPSVDPLAPGEIISSGTLTSSCSIAPGETWSAVVEGLDLPPLTLRCD
jgi:2-oxo-3-hexenedioate decarboxylase